MACHPQLLRTQLSKWERLQYGSLAAPYSVGRESSLARRDPRDFQSTLFSPVIWDALEWVSVRWCADKGPSSHHYHRAALHTWLKCSFVTNLMRIFIMPFSYQDQNMGSKLFFSNSMSLPNSTRPNYRTLFPTCPCYGVLFFLVNLNLV